MIRNLALAGLLLAGTAAHAEKAKNAKSVETVDAIDAAMGACVDKSGGGDFRVKECTSDAADHMDARLNQVYRTLMKKLSPENQDLLKDAQRRWLAWNKAEADLSYAIDPNQGGTLQGLDAVSEYYEALKARTKTLEKYLEDAEGK